MVTKSHFVCSLYRLAIVFLVVFSYVSQYVHCAKVRAVSSGYRLPDNIVPRKYNLEILTNLDENNFSFDGKVWIKIHCVKATNKIIVHTEALNITEKDVSVKHISPDNETISIPVLNHHYAPENSFYIVTLGQRLVPGSTYVYYIPFRGQLKESLAGYYRSSYLDRTSNSTKWLAVTQFEPTDARRAFPCFDEPAMKATFSISLGHANKFRAISNMPLKVSRAIPEKGEWTLDTFEETVPMSTYLVAYMVSEFDYQESDAKYSPNVTFRIWARKEAIGQIELAKLTGPRVLTYFEQYFDIDYPLPKQDMAAIPDFSAGAMENWGLITYRETALLYDPKQSSIFSKHGIASVISHELAHQWFGNLVTMEWWTDLWLNEGFATYVGALGVHHVYPEWKSFELTIIDDLLTVFQLDSLKSSHPVSVPIGHPSEIDQIFDTISYKKGAFLLHMINNFLGEAVFQKGVTSYLKQHNYGNAAQDHLWESLTNVAHAMGVLDAVATVKMIMDSWTLQTGYPVVTVVRDYEEGTAVLSQERFLSSSNGNDDDRKDKEVCWWIPLSYTNKKELKFNDTRPQTWLTCDGPIVLSPLPSANDWIVLNIRASALYRVNYDQHNWMLLGQTLENEKEYQKIDKLNRVTLIDDMLALAWVKQMHYTTVFNLLQYLRHETEYLPWKTALHSLGNINSMLIRSSAYGYFKKFMKYLLEPTYRNTAGRKITDIPKDYEGIKFHNLIVSSACYYGISECEDQVQQLFKNWYSNPEAGNPIPKDLRGLVYCQALKTGGEKYWSFLWDQYVNSNVATEKALILSALGCIKDVWILKRYLKWSIDTTRIRKQDSISVFDSVAHNEIGYLLAKEFLMKNFQDIRQHHRHRLNRLGRYVKNIANQITSKDDLTEFQSFVNSVMHELKESEIAVRQGFETANKNIVWHAVHFPIVSQYLTDMSSQAR